LLWAATHPAELAALAYLDEPVLLPDILAKLISYTPERAKLGGLWWWMMALAPGLAEQLIAGGNEHAFLQWTYEQYSANPSAVEPAAVEEYLRSFAGADGVSGAFAIYRATPETAEQTRTLTETRVRVPVLALGGGTKSR